MKKIRDENGKWLDTSVFRQEALHFQEYGYYTEEPVNSPAWIAYWVEQRKRIIEGYEVAGEKITGEHYFYLNFCPIMLAESTTKRRTKKVKDFPRFWDGDFEYFWVREIAKVGIVEALKGEKGLPELEKIEKEEDKLLLCQRYFKSLRLRCDISPEHLGGGYDLIVGKARRKGFSYKNAACAARNYFTKPGVGTIFNAYEQKYLYPNGIMTMTLSYINFINENTAYTMPSDYIKKVNHRKASYMEDVGGVTTEKGFLSFVQAYTCKDNPDANRGKDAEEIDVEEAGAFGTPGLLKNLYAASVDCTRASTMIKTGIIVIFGTSGDMTGGTADFAEMFSKPEAFGFLPFNNSSDEKGYEHKTGYFHPYQLNAEGFIDEQGNSDWDGAKKQELEQRALLVKKGKTNSELIARMQEQPLSSSEAFHTISKNNFPVVELERQLNKVKALDLNRKKGTPVRLKREGRDTVITEPVLNGKVEPITSYVNPPANLTGCPIIYEYPVGNAPAGLYKIGYDPIDQESGSSLAAIVVYKGHHQNSLYRNCIVAEYIGRYEDPDDIDRTAEMLAILYKTKIMHENMVTGVKNYFRKIKRLDLLAAQPDAVISKNIKNSRVARVYGCHMSVQLKDAGERYVKIWLTTILDYDENNKAITTIDQIYSQRLLEELINYSRSGNFDAVSALFMCMFQEEEQELNKVFGDDVETPIKKTARLLAEMYENNYD